MLGLALAALASGCSDTPTTPSGKRAVVSGAARPAGEQPGLAIGIKAPAFTLEDQNGAKQSLDELRKNGPVAIVFSRSHLG
jgi:hypothetical protein